MKYVSIRIPETGPLGETFREANAFAIVAALLVNKPGGGCVESVVTLAIHLFFPAVIDRSSQSACCIVRCAFIALSGHGKAVAGD
jgi:hypothetical protein